MIKSFQKDVTALVKTCMSMTYFMRGSYQYEDILNRSYSERQMIAQFIEERMEMQQKIPYPIL